MAGYNEIRGLRVKYLSADPANAENGQVWYNSTSGKLRVQGIGSSAWSSASPMANGREFGSSGIGTQAANIVAGGYIYSPGRTAQAEEYNGSGWENITNINAAKYVAGGAGSVTAGLIFGGSPGPGSYTGDTEEYNGSSWSEQNNMSTDRNLYNAGAGGPSGQTAGLVAGGYDGSAKTGNVETWDGTNWTEVANLNQTRNGGALVGSSTAAIGFGGIEPPFTGKTEFWNGSTWTELNDLNTSRYTISGAGPSYTAALAFGGYGTTYDAETEEWNGTSWTEVSDLNTARYGIGATVSASSLNSLLAFGGDEAPPANNKTEFWNGSSWSELAELSSNRFQMGGAGTSGTGALSFGGAPNPVATSTEEWTVNLANKTITAS